MMNWMERGDARTDGSVGETAAVCWLLSASGEAATALGTGGEERFNAGSGGRAAVAAANAGEATILTDWLLDLGRVAVALDWDSGGRDNSSLLDAEAARVEASPDRCSAFPLAPMFHRVGTWPVANSVTTAATTAALPKSTNMPVMERDGAARQYGSGVAGAASELGTR